MLTNGYLSNRLYKMKMWFLEPQNRIWLTPLIGIVLALFLLILAWYLDTHTQIPNKFAIDIKTLDSILDVIASSMLAVATFSLGIMVAAFSSVSSSITPRATYIVMSDQATQKAISSFLAAFLYAVVAKIALGQGIYGKNGTYVLFLFTLFVLAYLVYTLIKWVRTLSTLGRLDDTVKKVETIANKQLKKFWQEPNFSISTKPLTEHRYHILSTDIGYVTNINFKELNAYCNNHHLKLDIMVRHGDFVGYQDILCFTNDYIKNKKEILQFFIIEDTRRHDNNPSYGLTILSEIGQRALSPAVNDPGTAIYILTVISKILNQNAEIKKVEETIKYENISIKPYDKNSFIAPILGPIARDGKEILEILIHLQKILSSLSKNIDEELAGLAKNYAKILFHNAQKELRTEEEKEILNKIRKSLFT